MMLSICSNDLFSSNGVWANYNVLVEVSGVVQTRMLLFLIGRFRLCLVLQLVQQFYH